MDIGNIVEAIRNGRVLISDHADEEAVGGWTGERGRNDAV
jgi:hypothetical protein